MKIRFSLLFLLAAAFASAGTSTVNFTTLPVNTAGGYYVGYTGATVDGVAQNLLCDDMLHTTGVPSGPFTYNVSTLPDLADVRFTGLANYETAAVLLWEFDNSNQTDAGAYNFALWNIFDPAAGSDGDSAALLANAQSIVANGGIFAAYQDTRVLTPIPGGPENQEFLFLSVSVHILDDPAVPEPQSYLLFGSGLIVLAMVSRRSLRRR